MMGKFCITASYGIVCLYASELFPTTVRSQSSGIAALCGRVGGMLAPFTSVLNNIEPWLTAVVFGIVSITGGLLALILPETNRRPLPQTIEDIENWYKPAAPRNKDSPSSENQNGHTTIVPNGNNFTRASNGSLSRTKDTESNGCDRELGSKEVISAL